VLTGEQRGGRAAVTVAAEPGLGHFDAHSVICGPLATASP
jgi:hypothetical protein